MGASLLFGGCQDGVVAVWDPRVFEKEGVVARFRHPQEQITSVAPLSNELTLCGAFSGRVYLWDLRYPKYCASEGKPVNRVIKLHCSSLHENVAVVTSPTDRIFVVSCERPVLSAAPQQVAPVVSHSRFELRRTTPLFNHDAGSVVTASDFVNNTLLLGFENGAVQLHTFSVRTQRTLWNRSSWHADS
eukprot:GILK01012511.1.p1 GENE.GILK01012511.1~~GILK01012511.1.p1  ORF type:complete len:188 (-),score=13.16 GILK01012511.1:65-628(-)